MRRKWLTKRNNIGEIPQIKVSSGQIRLCIHQLTPGIISLDIGSIFLGVLFTKFMEKFRVQCMAQISRLISAISPLSERFLRLSRN